MAALRRDVYQGIADPTRREIMDILIGGPLNLNAVASHFEISRPAISQHIKILEGCQLISIEKQGRERICHARAGELQKVSDWVNTYRKFWSGRLDALEKFLAEDRGLKNKLLKQKNHGKKYGKRNKRK